MTSLGIAAFALTWVLFIAAMVYLFIEGLAVFSLRPWAFRYGPVVLRESILSTSPTRSSSEVQFTDSGRYRWITPDTAIFCFGRTWFGLRWRTLMPIKCKITWKNEVAEITGRLLIGSVLVQSFWLLGGAIFWVVSAGTLVTWETWWIAPTVMFFWFLNGPAWLPFEKRRALKVAREVIARDYAAANYI